MSVSQSRSKKPGILQISGRSSGGTDTHSTITNNSLGDFGIKNGSSGTSNGSFSIKANGQFEFRTNSGNLEPYYYYTTGGADDRYIHLNRSVGNSATSTGFKSTIGTNIIKFEAYENGSTDLVTEHANGSFRIITDEGEQLSISNSGVIDAKANRITNIVSPPRS